MEHRWLTVDQAAEYLQLTPITVLRWIKAGKLAAAKIGSQYRIDSTVLEQFIAGGK